MQTAPVQTVTAVTIAPVQTAADNLFRVQRTSRLGTGGFFNTLIKSIMKKYLIIILLFKAGGSYAQKDSLIIEQYCQVIATPRLLSNRVTISIDFGEERSIWRDERLRTYDGRLRKFNTIIDALNYMGRDGWLFINAYPVTTGTGTVYHFAFKKEFRLAETGPR